MMILCLILALVFGSTWYADLQTAEVDRPPHTESAGPTPVEAQQPRSSVVCAPVEWENHFPNYCGPGEPPLQGVPEDGQGRQKITCKWGGRSGVLFLVWAGSA